MRSIQMSLIQWWLNAWKAKAKRKIYKPRVVPYAPDPNGFVWSEVDGDGIIPNNQLPILVREWISSQTRPADPTQPCAGEVIDLTTIPTYVWGVKTVKPNLHSDAIHALIHKFFEGAVLIGGGPVQVDQNTGDPIINIPDFDPATAQGINDWLDKCMPGLEIPFPDFSVQIDISRLIDDRIAEMKANSLHPVQVQQAVSAKTTPQPYPEATIEILEKDGKGNPVRVCVWTKPAQPRGGKVAGFLHRTLGGNSWSESEGAHFDTLEEAITSLTEARIRNDAEIEAREKRVRERNALGWDWNNEPECQTCPHHDTFGYCWLDESDCRLQGKKP